MKDIQFIIRHSFLFSFFYLFSQYNYVVISDFLPMIMFQTFQELCIKSVWICRYSHIQPPLMG